MKTLIVEDDFTSRILLQSILQPYGSCQICVNGREALDAFKTALEAGVPYQLVCLDIMMPEMDGQTALKEMRLLENKYAIPAGTGAKIIMTTALDDKRSIMNAFKEQCDVYLVKPIEREKLVENLKSLQLIS